MDRSFWTQPVDRSSRRAFVLLAAAAVLSVLLGTLARGLLFTAQAKPMDPLAVAQSHQPGFRILFIGNSFTSSHAMPTMAAQLVAATPGSRRRVIAVQYAPAGAHLADTVQDPRLVGLVRSVRWNIVVLQDQSQVPALPYWLVHESLPAVRRLVALIRRDGARPVLFETWGYRSGDRQNFPEDSYAAMQGRLSSGYGYLARETGIDVVPVGDTWNLALTRHPAVPLWDPDGHHPSLEGAYLTAAAFAAALPALAPARGAGDPVSSTYTAGLDPTTAGWLRHVAEDLVHADQGRRTAAA